MADRYKVTGPHALEFGNRRYAPGSDLEIPADVPKSQVEFLVKLGHLTAYKSAPPARPAPPKPATTGKE